MFRYRQSSETSGTVKSIDRAMEIFTTISRSWMHLRTDGHREAEADMNKSLWDSVDLFGALGLLHGGLLCAVSFPLPGLRALWGSKPKGPYRRLGEGNPQVSLHSPLCAFYSHIISSDLATFQRNHKFAAP